LNEAERLAPSTDEVGIICNACSYELEVAGKRAESEQPVAEVVLTNELREIRRENAKLLIKIDELQEDVSSIYAWVLFMGVLTLLGLIAAILALFNGLLRG
jgi:hypothetical protein